MMDVVIENLSYDRKARGILCTIINQNTPGKKEQDHSQLSSIKWTQNYSLGTDQ
jgi:hypothetical protein